MAYNVTVIGASGYTGAELIRILLNHPEVVIKNLVAESNAGKSIAEIYSHLAFTELPNLIKFDEADFSDVDIVFLCLPHATTQEIAKKIPPGIKIIDLSADFRISDPETYNNWYGSEHKALKLQNNAIYGLTEINRDKIKSSNLIACPGCYPTSILLPLIPLVEKNLIKSENIIADSKSGISGAGRKAVQPNLFTEVNENVRAYGLGGHRHVAEIEQELKLKTIDNEEIQITFTPQVVPMNRGIISCIYVKNNNCNAKELKSALKEQYKNENFVRIAEGEEVPTIRDVYSTNLCYMNVFEDRVKGSSIIISVIDNLVKGASGQAVQNMNLILGLDEKIGLRLTPVFP